MSGTSMGLTGLETPSATRLGGPASSANLLAEGDRPGPIGMNTPSIPAEELNGGGVVDAQKILNYASSNAGQAVGKKQCFDLADLALRGAGARSALDFALGGVITKDAHYIWGTDTKIADVTPGDIIQFLNYAYTSESTKTTPRVYTDGTPVLDKNGKPEFDVSTTSGTAEDRPHHTAIVKSVGKDGLITVWEQNVPTGDPIRSFNLYFQNATIDQGNNTVLKVKVSGKVTFYRPQSRS